MESSTVTVSLPFVRDAESEPARTKRLLSLLRQFCLPRGADAVRDVREVHSTSTGLICSAPGARPVSFTAEEVTDARASSFRWRARLAGDHAAFVTDAYEDHRGRALVEVGGLIQAESVSGPEFDKGELQRYLGSVLLCPAMLVNNGDLEWTSVASRTLRLRDRRDATRATVDYVLSESGWPIVCRAERPRQVGKETVLTPWSAVAADMREKDGLRIAHHLQASWIIDGLVFTYFTADLTSVEIVRG